MLIILFNYYFICNYIFLFPFIISEFFYLIIHQSESNVLIHIGFLWLWKLLLILLILHFHCQQLHFTISEAPALLPPSEARGLYHLAMFLAFASIESLRPVPSNQVPDLSHSARPPFPTPPDPHLISIQCMNKIIFELRILFALF